MVIQLYSVYDTVSCVFHKPFTDINDASASRSFSMSADEQPHIRDYELYNVASMDDNTGIITPRNAPHKIITGLEVAAMIAGNDNDSSV